MKVILSHDVDHLFAKDHWMRDLIYPKLCVRSGLSALKGSITWKECFLRMASCFHKERNCLDAVMDFDSEHGVKSTFFFGMNQGLGMSYRPHEAKDKILNVHARGFDVGVHGICFDNEAGIQTEYDTFFKTTGMNPCGIRMHYVRFDDATFPSEAKAGYAFDTSEFDKESGHTIKAPYKVQTMWEFPLTIMDAYLPQSFEKAKEETLRILDRCEETGLEFVTVLFHDNQFCDAYADIKNWYVWLVEYLSDSDKYEFISFGQAINELESKHD